jgi:hypothetical protein
MAVNTTKTEVADEQTQSTEHGCVQFWCSLTAPAQQAGLDVAALNATLGDGVGSRPGGIATISAAGVSAAAGVASEQCAGGSFGLGAANAVSTSGSLELTIVNYSSNPVVLYDCNPTKIDIVDMPNPLASGSSDILAFSGSSTSSAFTVFFAVGSGQASIPFQLGYTYKAQCGNPGRWTLQAGADGSPECSYPPYLQMFGLSFSGDSGYPSFSVYTSIIETFSGALSIAIYDKAPE